MTQRQKVLSMLEEAGDQGCTTQDFLTAYIPRFSARVMELNHQGHRITSERVREGQWRYVLLSEGPARGLKAAGEDGRVSPPRFESDVPSERSNTTSDSLFSLEPQKTGRSAITGKVLGR